MTRRARLWAAGVPLAVVAVAAFVGPTAYRVLRGLDRYERTASVLAIDPKRPAILLLSKTNGFRHDAAIRAADAMFTDIARQSEWSIATSENGAIVNPARLAHFGAVIWNNVSDDVLTIAQRAALRRYIEQGGGFVAVHGAGGDLGYRWRWYVEEVIGTQFIGHPIWPQRQRGVLTIEDTAHPAMAGLPRKWARSDEWYSFDRSVRAKGYRILATLDERSYSPRGLFGDDLRMELDHPVAWSHCVGRGPVFYSALGHYPESYAEPHHRLMLANAVTSALRDGRAACASPARAFKTITISQEKQHG